MAIEEKNGQAGGYTIKYNDEDDSTAAAGKWDEATEIKNANDAVANDKLVAYIGTFNSGAAKLSIPILCGKGIAMVSPANTYPRPDQGRQGRGRRAGQVLPERLRAQLLPRRRRLTTSRAWPARSGPPSSAPRTSTSSTTPSSTARASPTSSTRKRPAHGLTVLGRDGIDGKATDYKALAEKIKATNPDLVYYGGITQNNAGQLWRDLRDAMPDVKLMGPDGILEQELIDAAGDGRRGHLHHLRWPAGRPADRQGRRLRQELQREVPEQPARGLHGLRRTRRPASSSRRSRRPPRRTRPTSARSAPPSSTGSCATKDYEGALGTWSFNAEGDTSLTAMSGIIVKDGKFAFDSVIE